MGIDLASIGAVAAPAVILILLGFCTKVVGGFLAGRSVGHTPAQSAVVGLSLVPKGEFSIVIAALAATASGNNSQIEALTGVYVFALAFLGPVGMREADRIWRAPPLLTAPHERPQVILVPRPSGSRSRLRRG